MHESYDVLVIGAGPAGTMAALHAAELGARVAVVEKYRTGGTCTNTGCVPTRVLAKTARTLRDIRAAGTYGIQVNEPSLDWSQTRQRVRQVIEEVHGNKRVSDNIRAIGGDLFIEGAATFCSEHEVRLADSGRVIRADKIILCVGGHSRRLPIPGVEHALYPENILDLESLPRSVAIVGSGYTGVQIVTIMNAFGAEVTLLEMQPQILPTADRDVGALLRENFVKQGVAVVAGIGGVERIDLLDDGRRRLIYTSEEQQRSVECDAVFLCAGWPASVEGLGLEAIGVEVEKGYIQVNEYLQSSVPHIFVAGDANGQGMLVQGAHFEAYVAAENAVRGPQQAFKHALLPNGGFTDPDHAGVGLTEEQARKEHPDCLVAVAHFCDLDRAIIDNRKVGFLKLIADRETMQVIGAHAAGEHAVEVIQAVATAMAAEVTATTLAGIELAYPTYTAIVGMAASQLAPDAGHATVRPIARPDRIGAQGEDRS
jgi:pyruvate/2-oxoglutarate dehydrogenase complex dihydrolipoamide dehydrogenase (E3) component